MNEEIKQKKTIPLVSLFLQEKEDGEYYSPNSSIESTFLHLSTSSEQMAAWFLSFFKPYLNTLPEEQREQYTKDTMKYINMFVSMDLVKEQIHTSP
jgi:hypothetical protein